MKPVTVLAIYTVEQGSIQFVKVASNTQKQSVRMFLYCALAIFEHSLLLAFSVLTQEQRVSTYMRKKSLHLCFSVFMLFCYWFSFSSQNV